MMKTLRSQTLSMQIAVLSGVVIAAVSGLLALAVHWRMSDHALESANEGLARQAEIVRVMLDLAYDNEHARAERSIEHLSKLFAGAASLSQESENSVPTLRLADEVLNGDCVRCREFYTLTGVDSAVLARRGDDFVYVAAQLGGKPNPGPIGKPLLKVARVDVRQRLLAGERAIDLALRDGKYAMVAYAPLKDGAGQVVGALATRTTLDNAGLKALREQLARIKVARTGYVLGLVAEPGSEATRFVLHPVHEGKLDSELSEAAQAVLRQALKLKEGRMSYVWPTGDGTLEEKVMVVIHSTKWDWVLGATGPREEFVADANDLRDILVVLLLAGGIFTLLAVFFAVRTRTAPMAQVLAGLREAELGNMAIRLPEGEAASRNEIDVLARTVNATLASTAHLIRSIGDSAAKVTVGAGALESSAGSLAEASEQQNQAAVTMANAVEHLSSSIDQVAENARTSARIVEEARAISENGRQEVGVTIEGIAALAARLNDSAAQLVELGDKSGEIAGIVDVIKSIADQTNLLALNAAIEAARAGEQGRGFAVVADEVRKLAERTSQATQEIAGRIGAIVHDTASASSDMQALRGQMGDGMQRLQGVGELLQAVAAGNRKATSVAQEIAAATGAQTKVSGEFSRQVEAISQMSGSNTAIAQSNRHEAQTMLALADALHQQVRRFQT
ncbi:MAG: methyl-accepting chemotaxis protein [Candidatus Accumulibacter sp.]|uniref:methyl-accepting chemotaxis protein n=1 Tax=Accumulibacter sp. TaxID=2053492 RepID=UPI00287B1494|nr:methyl-accepting chemotaxis protein [Accumulibacter sp.]MDS4015415.1 methyl-accepting chemotaxis protein [Accumulibacter sp.]